MFPFSKISISFQIWPFPVCYYYIFFLDKGCAHAQHHDHSSCAFAQHHSLFFGLFKRLCVCICSDIELRFWISVGFRIWRRRFAMLTRIDPLFEQQVATGLWRQFKLYRMGIFMHFVLLWVSFGLWVSDFFCVFLLEM